MTKQTLEAIAAFAAAIGFTAKNLASLTPVNPVEANPDADPQPAPTRRGRGPAKTTETPPAETEKPAAQATVAGLDLRELIRPLVEDGRGEEVKKLIAKHGGTKLSDLPAAAHAAFTRDIEALTI